MEGTSCSTQQGPFLTDIPIDVLEIIMGFLGAKSAVDGFKCRSVCKHLKRATESDAFYKSIEVDSIQIIDDENLKEQILGKCRDVGNLNLLYREGMVQYFYFINDDAREMIEKASKEGHRDAIYVIGMLLMAEGRHRKDEAVVMLNAAFRGSQRYRYVRETIRKVATLFFWGDDKRQVQFHGCLLTCANHHNTHNNLLMAYNNMSNWVVHCDVCLWDATFIIFARMFGINFS